MKLDCTEAKKRIQPYLDRTLEDHDCAVFLDHVRHCESCREELETGFLVEHALEYLDESDKDSFDISKLLKEDIRRVGLSILMRRISGVFLWIGIVILTALIFLILLRFMSPVLFRELGALVLKVLRIDTDYTFWELLRLRLTGSL